MPSNVFQQMNGNIPQQNPQNTFNNFQQNPQNFLNSLQQFANSFKGNPQQMVQQLLQSGRMSQQSYNMYRQIAQNFLHKN